MAQDEFFHTSGSHFSSQLYHLFSWKSQIFKNSMTDERGCKVYIRIFFIAFTARDENKVDAKEAVNWKNMIKNGPTWALKMFRSWSYSTIKVSASISSIFRVKSFTTVQKINFEHQANFLHPFLHERPLYNSALSVNCKDSWVYHVGNFTNRLKIDLIFSIKSQYFVTCMENVEKSLRTCFSEGCIVLPSIISEDSKLKFGVHISERNLFSIDLSFFK